jgi:hypothetical protein
MFIVTAKTSSSFTLLLSEDIDSSNYFVSWSVVEDELSNDVIDTVSLTRINVSQFDSPVTMIAYDCTGFNLFTNTGSTSEIIMLLPPGDSKYRINVIITSNFNFKFVANSMETIRYLTMVSKPGGSIASSSIGDELQLDWNGVQWIANILGTSWQLETS